jgi:hypothetical protein
MKNQRESRSDPPGQTKNVPANTQKISLLGGFRLQQGDKLVGTEQFRLRKACSLIKILALASGHRAA